MLVLCTLLAGAALLAPPAAPHGVGLAEPWWDAGLRSAPVAADTPDVPLRLPSGLSYRAQQRALGALRPLSAPEPDGSGAPVGPDGVPAMEIDGLLVDETASKIGRDFYDVFYTAWQAPRGASNYTIRIQEQPAPGRGTRVILLLNDETLFQLQLQPRYEVVEELAQQAAAFVRRELERRQLSEVPTAAGSEAEEAAARAEQGRAEGSGGAPARPLGSPDARVERQAEELESLLDEGSVRQGGLSILVRLGDELRFGSGSAELVEPAEGSGLERLAASLRRHPGTVVVVVGHTDDSGRSEANQRISLARANAVAAYLARRGVDPERLRVRGVGERQPVATNGTEDGRRMNRRVEVLIVPVEAWQDS